MIKLNEEYRAASKAFKKKFGYGVPLRMIPPNVDNNELLKNIYHCIDCGEDTLLQSFDVHVDINDLI